MAPKIQCEAYGLLLAMSVLYCRATWKTRLVFPFRICTTFAVFPSSDLKVNLNDCSHARDSTAVLLIPLEFLGDLHLVICYYLFECTGKLKIRCKHKYASLSVS